MGQGDADHQGDASHCVIAPAEPTLARCIRSASQASGRPFGPLLLQGLLQLPRLADRQARVLTVDAQTLLSDLAIELPPASEWLLRTQISSPRELRFANLAAVEARDVMERFHYLRSPRNDGRSYALLTSDRQIVAVCVTSPLDVEHVERLLSNAVSGLRRPRVLSRVFAFEGSPANSISYLLARVGREERRLGTTDLVTYVNPNMGFTGSSYRASGWRVLGDEPGTTNRYLDGRYITQRVLEAEFGRHDDGEYQSLLGNRFAVSVMSLAPLLLFHTSLK
jgi:hypothetical protein